MPILKISDETLRQAAEVLCRGGLAAFPTETVYGLGGDAYNTAAIAKIFEAKNRPRFDPLIIHIAALETLEAIADLSLLGKTEKKKLAALTGRFWPGPLTLILPKKQAVPDFATSGLPTVAVRLPALMTARRLIGISTGALAAPSANLFGYLSPTRAEHVYEQLGEKVEIILDGGPSRVGLESTVLDICGGRPRILRPGGTPKEAIEALIGAVAEAETTTAATTAADIGAGGITSPGMLKSHYAPRVRLSVHETLFDMPADETCAFLFFDGASRDKWLSATRQEQKPPVKVLSETGNLTEAAARLFDALHELDQLTIKHIYAQNAPEEGLGTAINDRLCRASAKVV